MLWDEGLFRFKKNLNCLSYFRLCSGPAYINECLLSIFVKKKMIFMKVEIRSDSVIIWQIILQKHDERLLGLCSFH